MTLSEITCELTAQAEAERRPLLAVVEDHLEACNSIKDNLSIPNGVRARVVTDEDLLKTISETIFDGTPWEQNLDRDECDRLAETVLDALRAKGVR